MEWFIGLLALRWLLPDRTADDDELEGWTVVVACVVCFLLIGLIAPVLWWFASYDWSRAQGEAKFEGVAAGLGSATLTTAALVGTGVYVNWWAASGLAWVFGAVALVLIARAARKRTEADETEAFAEEDYHYGHLS